MAIMASRAFVDANILLRAIIEKMEKHEECKQLLEDFIRDQIEIWINYQVIREYLVRATYWDEKTGSSLLTIASAIYFLDLMLPNFRIAKETDSVYLSLREILVSKKVTGKHIHDANHIATMLEYNIDTLYTMDTKMANRYNGYKDRIEVRDENGILYSENIAPTP